jgi:hypothetical protein
MGLRNYTNICVICGKEFKAARITSKHCYTIECKRAFTNKVNNSEIILTKKEFNPEWFNLKLQQKIMYNRKLDYLKKEGLLNE